MSLAISSSHLIIFPPRTSAAKGPQSGGGKKEGARRALWSHKRGACVANSSKLDLLGSGAIFNGLAPFQSPPSQTTKPDGNTASSNAPSNKPQQQQQKKKAEPKVNIAKMSVEQIQKLKARAERFGNTELLR